MMKYETGRDDLGHISLKLGLNHSVHFEPDASIEDIVEGVESLIQQVVGVSAFELVTAVLKEVNKEDD